MENKELLSLAHAARGRAYAPYSNWTVGAALLTKSGKVFEGCNIENSAYGPSVCAERVAIFTAVCAGEREFEKIAIVGGNAGEEPDAPCPPCGVCRQVMSEFCGPEFQVVLEGEDGEPEVHTLGELLPLEFTLKQ